MRAWLVWFAAACGGGGGGDSSVVDAKVVIDGVEMPFREPCELKDTGEYFDFLAAKDGEIGIEVRWKKTAITAAGTYRSEDIFSDLAMFALHPVDGEPQISSAEGEVTFETFMPPEVVTGTFSLAVTGGNFGASGRFECQ